MGTVKTAFLDAPYPWRDISTAPRSCKVLICGGGPVRFGYLDDLGNWRASHHGPVKGTPKYWAPIPRPKTEDSN